MPVPKPESWTEVLRAMKASAQADALIDAQGRTLSYSDLLVERARWHAALAAKGLRPSHRIATVFPDGTPTAVALLSLLDVASVMPMNMATPPARISEDIVAGAADCLLVWRANLALANEALEHAPGLRPLVAETRGGGIIVREELAPPMQPERRPGLTLLTSGSTSTPRRVPLQPDQLAASAATIAAHLGLSRRDRAIHALAKFHVGAVVDLLVAPLASGGSSVIVGTQDPVTLPKVILNHGATWLQLVPTSLRRFIENIDASEAAPIGDALRFVRIVSADLTDTLRAEAEACLPGTEIVQM